MCYTENILKVLFPKYAILLFHPKQVLPFLRPDLTSSAPQPRTLPATRFFWFSIQSLSHVQFFATPWTAACQGSLFIINSCRLLKLMSVESVKPSNSLIFCRLHPSPPTFILSQHQGLFKWVRSSHQVAKVLEFQLQHQSFQRIFRTDFL